jgi:hypothetical protein
VFWDSTAADGLGDIVKKNVDVHNLFWEPGITDIQESRAIFHVTMEDVEVLKAMYPKHADKFGPSDSGTVTKYLHDDTIDTANMCEVVDMYYKETIMVPGVTDDETGEVMMHIPKKIVHYVKYCGSVVLYSSADDEAYAERGYYDHGKYPFVIRSLFPVKDSPWGFGFVDVMKSPQGYIDSLDQLILKNAHMKGTPRWFAKNGADIDLEKFADWNQVFIPVAGTGDISNSLMQVQVDTIPAMVTNHLINKVEELKETSANRDFSQGSTSAGVTAASAIAALQEAGGKIARHINKIMYNGTVEEGMLEVELIRQFYTEPRSFRVDDGKGHFTFVEYETMQVPGERKAIFDIDVSAEKQSPFSRAAQNETAKEMYGMGMFNPQMAEPALACLNMMEFEGKEAVADNIQRNSALMAQMAQMQQVIMQADMMMPGAGFAVQAGLVDPAMAAGPAPAPKGGSKEGGTPEERAAKHEGDTTLTAKARLKAANAGAIA